MDDAALLIRLYHRDGLSLRAIAGRLGCSRNAVRSAVERHGITLRTGRRPRQLDSRRWLRRAYHGQGRSARSIADELGCRPNVVVAALHRLGIATRPQRPQPSDRLADGAWLRQRYVKERVSIVRLAGELGCSAGAVRRALHDHGISVRPAGAPRIDQLYDRAWLRKARSRSTPEAIAERLGCSVATVRSALWRSGISPGPGRGERPPALDDVSFLLREYVRARRSTRDLATELGCSATTVLAALRRQGIAVRSPIWQGDIRVLRPHDAGSAGVQGGAAVEGAGELG